MSALEKLTLCVVGMIALYNATMFLLVVLRKPSPSEMRLREKIQKAVDNGDLP